MNLFRLNHKKKHGPIAPDPPLETTMPAETITLNQNQAEDLQELLSYAQILEDWLLHAPDDILHELARFAYHEHFHPYSAAWWLIEDLGHLGCRLRNTFAGHQQDQDRPAAAPTIKAITETETRPSASARDGLDTATTIGNQNSLLCGVLCEGSSCRKAVPCGVARPGYCFQGRGRGFSPRIGSQ